jgi:putative redox protein
MSASSEMEPVSTGTVVVVETGVERLQLVARTVSSVFLAGGAALPSPYELLAASLGSCTAITLRLYAEHQDLPVSRLQTTVAYTHLFDGASAYFERRIVVDGDLSDEDREGMLRAASRCPVARTIGLGVEIRTRRRGPVGLAAATPTRETVRCRARRRRGPRS